MNTGHCLACGEPLVSWARADRRTCSMGCRTRLCRMRKAERSNTSATGTAPSEPRSAPKWPPIPPRVEPVTGPGPEP